MDLKMMLSVLAIAVLGFFGIMLLLPENVEDETPRLPWLVDQDQAGRTRVFGFTLGETTLGGVREVFGEAGEINLFRRPDAQGGAGLYAVEAYFEQIYLNRLRADFVFGLDADQPALEAMYERGLRISQLGSGSKKVKLDPADVETLVSAPIGSITYLPWKSLDADIIRNRFGVPAEKRTEPETGVTHWLYPGKGMDVAIDEDGGVVIQYVNRGRFQRISAPLADSSGAKGRTSAGAADQPAAAAGD
jgi:hypothetical protein